MANLIGQMDERTVYLFARHQGTDDSEAALFVAWFFDGHYDVNLRAAYDAWFEYVAKQEEEAAS